MCQMHEWSQIALNVKVKIDVAASDSMYVGEQGINLFCKDIKIM